MVDPRFQPFIAHATAEAVLAKLPAGWDAAEAYPRLLRAMDPQPFLREVGNRAVDAVVARARDLVHHARRPTRAVEGGWPEPGDLDLESTLDRPPPWVPDDLRVRRLEPRDAEVVLALDMSLSMTGEKVALVAVASAILQMKLETVAVVAFDTTAHVLVPVGRPQALRTLVRRVLEVSAQGYTNIEAGLGAAADQLGRSRRRERVALLLTDGLANVGWDPVRQAVRLPRLHVVHVGSPDPRGLKTCRKLARAGRGEVFRAETWRDLPRVMRDAVHRLFRV